MKKISWLPVVLSLLISIHTAGQDYTWKSQFNGLSWNEFVHATEQTYPVKFYYDSDTLPKINVPFYSENINLLSALDQLLSNYGLQAISDQNGHIFIAPEKTQIETISPAIFNITKTVSGISVTPTSNGENFMQTNQQMTESRINIGRVNNDGRTKATISGYVHNAGDNSPVIGVLVRADGTNAAVMSDVSGFYSLYLDKGDYTLIAGNLETKERKINVRVLSDGRLDILLEPKLVTLNAVVISADKQQIVKNTQMGYQRLSTKEIKEIPVVLGEQDVIKVSLLLPGIQSVGEGSSGVNVRGSPTDQNLFIINNIPVYNSSHLLGFFSAFNSDAIRDFELYKSNLPAGLGGRLSSVFDIRTRQGNQNNFNAQGGISPVTARLTLEGPIIKKESSYMVAFRSTYSDWILGKIDDPDISKSKAGFADAITDFSFDLNNNNRLRFSSYHSTDHINLINQSKYDYRNNGAVLAWSHLFREKNNFNLSLIYSRYDFTERNSEMAISSYKDNFDLQHSELKAAYTFRPRDKHTFTFGINSILYLADQGKFRPLDTASMVNSLNLEKEKAVESGIFISDEWIVNSNLTLTGAIRYNNYLYLGPQQLKIYQKGEAITPEHVTDTISYGNNKVIKSHQAPDVRFSARYMITPLLSLKLSYSRMQQYIFMLSNTIAISPTDKWKLSDNYIKPMWGDQYSFGVYNTLFEGRVDITAEAYYKKVRNLIDYKNGANLVVNENPETDIVQGDLETYGVEFMLSKPKGRFNGWLNYTWSKAIVNVVSLIHEQQINNNKPFPSNYDKPHAVNLVANYKFSRRLSVSSNLVYSTGRPITYPVGFYNQGNIRVPLYSQRNEYRVPDYFRVDLSFKLEGNLISEKFAHGTWMFSIYNITSRRNAYSIFYRYEDGTMKGYKMSIFGVPIVSLSYSFKLGNYAN
jgi:hypothetical protein